MDNISDGVLIIYTGGTIGSVPRDKDDPLSPLVPGNLEQLLEWVPNYHKMDKKIRLGNSLVRLGTYSFKEPLDSSNIMAKDWKEMAQIIKNHYKEYEGFVVLHGTDTMAYTASALSFMLVNLSKPVVITGSQKPIGDTRSDAVQNLVSAIEIAAAKSLNKTIIPEVCVFFRDFISRGCRTSKISASAYSGFNSPNYPLLGTAGEHIVIQDMLLEKGSSQALSLNHDLEENIASLDIFPGLSPSLLNNILNTENLKGVILKTFGTGNAPTTPDFLNAIGDAVERGIMVVNVTQCKEGEVELGLYEVSAGLLSRGVISGQDMTPEAALTKMAVILGKEKDIETAKDKMQITIRGEQKQSIFNLHFGSGKIDDDEKPFVTNQLRPMVHGLDRYNSETVNNAVIRIMGIRIPDSQKGRFEFKAYIDLPEANENTSEDGYSHFLGRSSKKYDSSSGGVDAIFPITEQVKNYIDNQHEITITVISTGGTPLSWENMTIAIFADC